MRTEPPARTREGTREGSVPRYTIQVPLRYRVLGPVPRPVGVGWTHTLSEKGVSVELGERLAPGTPLTVLLQTAQGSLELSAGVVWAGKPLPAGGGILHRLTFTEADAKPRQALRDLLQAQSGTARMGLRLPVVTPATCQSKYPPGPLLQGQTGDISREGLLLLLPEVMAPGTVLAVTLESPQGPVSLEGVVTWRDTSGRAALKNWVRHGVHLTSRDWATALALGDLVAEFGKVSASPREPRGTAWLPKPVSRQTLRATLDAVQASQRRFPRVAVTCPVLARVRQFPGRDLRGMVRNISRGGLLAEFPVELVLGSRVDLTLETRQGPLPETGRVIWASAAGDLVRHGIGFLQPKGPSFRPELHFNGSDAASRNDP